MAAEYNPAGRGGTAGYAFVGVADRVTGPSRHITYIAGAACDTTLFAGPDGRTYAVIPRGGIDLQEIDLRRPAEGRATLRGNVFHPPFGGPAGGTDPVRTVNCEDVALEGNVGR